MFCQVPPNQIIAVHDCRSIYHVPLLLEEQKMHDFISKRFGLNVESGLYLESWRNFAKGFVANEERTIRVAIVGKYTYLQDSYLSVSRALHHAGQYCNCQVQINVSSQLFIILHLLLHVIIIIVIIIVFSGLKLQNSKTKANSNIKAHGIY